MTEREIQLGLFLAGASSFSLMVPNYTPSRWWECDLFAVTKAGYFHEFEVKLTRADFAADADKGRSGLLIDREQWNAGTRVTKHELLAARSKDGPSCFWYVVPDGLMEAQDVPEWAGLQYAKRVHGEWFRFKSIKRAPRLHDGGCPAKVHDHAQSVCYWRFWKELRKVAKLSKKHE